MTRPFEGGGEDLSDLEKFATYARRAVEVGTVGPLLVGGGTRARP